ncbi:tyrosine-type recombinase/integrase [Clostridium magnum]|uniref:Tyrosine recombinase XerC n=1 Tax=Clostridium magnum DSM 2767 TaxID=1121326 RepID=A0A161W0P5_9CLOT|nr:tyrosine-type recombinase/integrase [Clostridium magnum]KZL88700.1 tyrosine recombinase XerC [Clostridium magnum DSM 2767]SHJ63910.1 Phage integrase family protein [Clostridium magnum DSM 2767]
MNAVEPIRDIQLVYDIADYLKTKNKRDYIMFLIGVNTGLRISDILKLRTRDIKDSKGKIRNHITLQEEKTGKDKKVIINDDLKPILKEYLIDKKEYEFIIKSPKGTNKSLSRQQAYRILHEVGEVFDIDSMGCHTLRKTLGYHYYKEKKDIAGLMDLYNHSSEAVTLRYIGVNQDNKDKIISKLKFIRKS